MSQDAGSPAGTDPSDAKRHEARAANDAWNITAYLLAGPIAWGGIGWLLDRWLGVDFLLPVGLMLGMGLALYLIWVRYGRS